MKNFKKLSQMLVLIGICLVLGSCKKKSELDPHQPPGLAKEELIPYYIAVEHKLSNNKIGLIYFSKEGNEVKATFHGDGYAQTGSIVANGQGFSFDANGDGNYVYSFSFDKDAEGKLIMKSYQFVDKTSASQGLAYAVIARKEDVPVFENLQFTTKEKILFEFKRDVNNVMNVRWDIKDRIKYETMFFPPSSYVQVPFPYEGPEFSKPYTNLSGLGWKEKEGILMGISVPQWKDSTKPVMLVEKGSTLYLATRQ